MVALEQHVATAQDMLIDFYMTFANLFPINPTSTIPTQGCPRSRAVISGALRTGSSKIVKNTSYVCMVITSLQFETSIPGLNQHEG